MRVIDVPKLHQGQCHLSRSSRRSSKWDSSGSFKSDRIEGKVKLAELLAQASFLEASFLEKRHQVEKDTQRLRIQENLAKARARAQIFENMELSEDQELQGKYWEIVNNLYIPGKSRRKILKRHTVDKIVII